MAFPTIETADTKNGTVTSNSSSWTITWPTNLAAGDLILLFAGVDGSVGFSFPDGGWVSRVAIVTGAATCGLLAKRIATGSESGTWTLTLSANEQGGWRIFRITGWHGTLGTDFSNDANGGSVEANRASTGGTSANPNPPNVDPFSWGTEDTLWIAGCSADTSRTISVYPLANNQTADVSGGTGGATLGLCTLNDAVASKDPGTFTISASDEWTAWTVAVRPAAAVVPPPRYGYVNYQDPGVFSVKRGIVVPRLWKPELVVPKRPRLALA